MLVEMAAVFGGVIGYGIGLTVALIVFGRGRLRS